MKCECGSEVEKGANCGVCDAKKARMALYDAAIEAMMSDPDRKPMDFYDIIDEVIRRANAMKAKQNIWDVPRPGHPMWEDFAHGVRLAVAESKYEFPEEPTDLFIKKEEPTVTIRACPACGSDEHMIAGCGHEGCSDKICLGCYAEHYKEKHPEVDVVSLDFDASQAVKIPRRIFDLENDIPRCPACDHQSKCRGCFTKENDAAKPILYKPYSCEWTCANCRRNDTFNQKRYTNPAPSVIMFGAYK